MITWLAALAVTLVGGAVGAGSAVAAALSSGFGWLSPALALMAAAWFFGTYQLLPKRRTLDAHLVLTPQDPELDSWLSMTTGRQDCVAKLHPWASVWADHDGVWIGLPVTAGLTTAQLEVAVQASLDVADTTRSRSSRLAARIVEGAADRALVSRDGFIPVGWLARCLEAPVATYAAAQGDLEREVWATPERGNVLARIASAGEAWAVICAHWLDPACAQGYWHLDPFTALERHLAAIATETLGSPSSVAIAHSWFSRHEPAVAQSFLSTVCEGGRPIEWAEHPHLLVAQAWRSEVSHALTWAGRLTGAPVPANLASLEDLVDADEHGPEAPLDTPQMSGLCVALVDRGHARLTWDWALGSVLETEAGRLPMPCAVADAEPTIRRAVELAALDPTEPLWLGHGHKPTPEVALNAMNVRQGARRRRLMITTQSLIVFPRPASIRQSLLMNADEDPALLDPLFDIVTSGAVGAATPRIWFDDVVRVRLCQRMGGRRSHLEVDEVDGTRTKMTIGSDGMDLAFDLSGYLDDRLDVRWAGLPAWVRRAWRWWVLTCAVVAAAGAAMSVAGLASARSSTDVVDWLQFAAASLGVLFLGMSPDLAAKWSERRQD